MNPRSARGAIIIQTAIFLLGLTAFSAFVIDYGVMWTSKAQAQNAADAGALAAAIRRLNDPDATDASLTEHAQGIANSNAVWLEAPLPGDVLVEPNLTCPPGTGLGSGCIRVDVLRGSTDRNGVFHNNLLPMFFGWLVGKTDQGVNATATAEVIAGNAVQCIKPWIVADKWLDGDETDTDPYPYDTDSWSRDMMFTPPGDVYDPTPITGTGFKPEYDTGTLMPLKAGNIGTWSAGWAMEIDFGETGSSAYKENIEGCPDWVPTVAIYDGTWKCDEKGDTPSPERGCVSVKTGMSQGPTSQGVNNLVDLDPLATWSPTGGPDGLGHVTGGCMDNSPPDCEDINGNALSVSARIVPIAAFNTEVYYDESAACGGTGCVAQVTNLIGFFIVGMCDSLSPQPAFCGTNSEAQKTVVGYLMRYPGQWIGTGGPAVNSFSQVVRLVR